LTAFSFTAFQMAVLPLFIAYGAYDDELPAL